jgi:hypothetical protein
MNSTTSNIQIWGLRRDGREVKVVGSRFNNYLTSMQKKNVTGPRSHYLGGELSYLY